MELYRCAQRRHWERIEGRHSVTESYRPRNASSDHTQRGSSLCHSHGKNDGSRDEDVGLGDEGAEGRALLLALHCSRYPPC